MAIQHNIAITQLVQVGLTEKTAQDLLAHPEMQSQAAAQMTPETLRKQGATVGSTDPSDKSRAISMQDKKNRDRRKGRQKEKEECRDAPEDETPSPPDSVWAGNILNLKV